VIYCDDDPLKKLTVPEGLCLLLERMELSKGFINFQQQTNRPHTSKNSLLPTKALLAAVWASKGETESYSDKKLWGGLERISEDVEEDKF